MRKSKRSIATMTEQELAKLRAMIEEESARRDLLKNDSEAIKGISESISQASKQLGVSEAQIINAVVGAVLGSNHAVYLKRGRAKRKQTPEGV